MAKKPRGKKKVVRKGASRRSGGGGAALPGDLSRVDFDTLTPAQIKAIKSARRASEPVRAGTRRRTGRRGRAGRARIAAGTPGRVVVAEGDSWFDLPLVYVVTDLLDCLEARHDYRIESFSKRGDTIENMVYGTERQNLRTRKLPPLAAVLEAVRRLQPRVFLFSGGGNDFVGDEFASFLNHAESGMNVIRDDYVNFMFENVFARAIRKVVDDVTAASPRTKVFMHGYGHAIPDGRGTRVVVDWAGPWMLPTLTSKGVAPEEHWGIVSELVDRYNAMLRGIALDPMYRERFVYVDVRDAISETDWVDELHLSSGGYARVSDAMHAAISAAVPGW